MIAWVLLVYGVTLAVTGSRIAKPYREWLLRHWPWAGHLVRCPMCVGFWSGVASWFIAPALCPIQGPVGFRAIGNGFVSLTACWAIHVILARLGAEEM